MAMKKRKLDRTRSYGTIYGGGSAVFEQDGIQFDGTGEELPGFEHVVVPDLTAVVSGENAEWNARLQEHARVNAQLQSEIGKLRDELDRARRDREESEARVEELQGQLDTATIEIKRLTALIEELSKPDDPDADKQTETGKESGKKKGGKEIEEQLAMQTGGKAS